MGSQTDTGKATEWTACEQAHQGTIREIDCLGAAETRHSLHDHYEG